MEFHTAYRWFGTSNPVRVLQAFNNYVEYESSDEVPDMQERWFAAVAQVMQAANQWPHYQVWPEYVTPLASVPLTNVRISDLKAPFPALTVQLPKTGDGLLFDDRPVEAITLLDYTGRDLIKAQDTLYRLAGVRRNAEAAGDPNDRNLVMVVQCPRASGDTLPGDKPMRERYIMFTDWLSPHILPPDAIFEEQLAGMSESAAVSVGAFDKHIPHRDYVQCWQLVWAVAFMATGQHRLVQPAVLNKDIAAYLAALSTDDKTKIQRLHNKASERRDSKGWTIGRMHQIVVGRPTTNAADSTPTGRQLQTQHIRSGHYHTYLVGEGRQRRVTKFVLPTVVRADLPLPAQGADRVLRRLQTDE